MENAGSGVAIRYFTGTGNSKRIAEVCASHFDRAGLSTEISALPGASPPAPDGDAACFVFPVYSLDLPRIARRYLESLPPARAKPEAKGLPALLLVTGGDSDDCGWSLLEGARLLAERGYDVSYADIIRMPNNWGTFSAVPGAEEAACILREGEAKAESAARSFLAGERFFKDLNLSKFGPLGSRLLRAGFKLGVKRLWSRFKTSDTCTGCGRCARACPTGSILMEGGRPRWSPTCEQCMRCFNLCPSRAITQFESIGHGSRRERYLEPHFRAGLAQGMPV